MGNQGNTFAIVGGGKMGEAILSGWLSSELAPADSISPADVVVVEPSNDRRRFLVDEYGVAAVADSCALARPDVVVLAVKPQVMFSVLEGMACNEELFGSDGLPLFVSIAAGITTARLELALPEGASVVRVMPNMPLSIGAGASGVCGGSKASADQVEYVAALFGCLGRAVVVDEDDMDVVCAVSGSGPAYVAAMIEALRDAGARQGLDAQLAETLALQTVLGTARFISETGIAVDKAREAVCSPGGTTLAALDAMNAAGFADVFDKGVEAAVIRSKELAQCS